MHPGTSSAKSFLNEEEIFHAGWWICSENTGRASSEAIDLTRRTADACAPLDIRMLDHFLVAGTEVLSFKENGWS